MSVSGRVVDFATNAAVSGATVAFGNFDVLGRFAAATTVVSDATGSYTARVAAGTFALVQIDGASAGQIHVTHAYRGDFLARTGTCVTRYGTVADALSLLPITGATVTLAGRSVVTASDGWYRIDLGCPSSGLVGFNTTFAAVSHPTYPSRDFVVGRGIFGTTRLDFSLQTRDFPCRREPLIQGCIG
jgi:hypothetical protein